MVIEKRMKALVKYENKDNAAKIIEVETPQINNDEFLIEVKYAGICGSDPHILHQNITYKINVPIILGHEYSGIIVKVGKNIKEWNIGDRVTSETHYYYCNECIMCKTGNYHLCSKRMGYGFDLVIDSAGYADTLKMAIKTVKPLGEIIKIGWGPKPINYSLDEIIAKSVKLIGSFSHYWIVWEKCINLLESGKINLSPLITHIKPLEEWQEAFELVEKSKGIKVIFKI